MSVLAFLRQHLREGSHHIEMQPVNLFVEASRVQGSLRYENRHGVIDVLFFLCCDGGEGPAQAPWCHLPDTGVTCDSEGFQHDFLDDQAPKEITFCNAAQECLAES